ncbi:helix-turn-helix transcriptional regulator [Olsenella sp. Marseille-P4559]|jgi:transcriptional regulator with XRE-family HTH domain|uniref:helix-turn-helix domain-containing protein n=1 Tax=Olsenella sp. Marseille-P4559 TaxID=2364795 RepID=UPI001031393A|nr:helix-turn-helix transcriptional regulator [Olsenella sp. Marseille-P4559]
MNDRVTNSALAGSIVRRVREDKGLSRAKLATEAGVSARSLYSFEMGESENLGLGHFLRILDCLGLSMFIGESDGADANHGSYAVPGWNDLGNQWRLDERGDTR